MKRLPPLLSKISWPRVMVHFVALESLFYGWVHWRFGQDNPHQFYVLMFFGLRFSFILLAAIIALIRRQNRYYLPLIKEMSVDSYWGTVLVLALMSRIPFLKYFQIAPRFDAIFSIIFITFSSAALFQFAIFFHQRYWARGYEEQRQLRIEQLRKEAGLSKKELTLVEPELVQLIRERQTRPLSWRIVQLVASFFVALLYNLLSSDIADFLNRILTLLPNSN